MNEQRLQDYLNLVQQLLDCPSGEESAILNANSELLDAGLVDALQQVSVNFAKNGDESSADFLQSLAVKIGEIVNKSLGNESEEEEYLKFLLEVLQVVSDSDANPQVVYPILQANLYRLNHQLAAVLQEWANNVLSETIADEAGLVVSTICNFGNLIQQFPLGSRSDNIELAIVAYQIGLIFFNRQDYPENWAVCITNLGRAYNQMIRGERGENLEQAIHLYEQALEVYSRQDYPENWAVCITNLGRAYNQRIRGERGENLEQAIHLYEQALEVYTREAFPEQWASLQNSLANAYSDRIFGERSNNLEIAIACYTSALEVYTLTNFSEQWATTQNNLGTAYKSRIRGDRSENLERAISCYQAALQIRTPDAFPEQWAATKNNFATFYSDRIKGDRAENLEMAINCYENALRVYTRDAFPSDWAMTQNNLGNAYSRRIRGNKAENLEMAIACYQAALQVRTRDAFPEQWAATQNNLGSAYSERILGEIAENIERAIACYEMALCVYTRSAFPEQWAMTHKNLGKAYSDRIKGAKYDNFFKVIQFYRIALEVFTPLTFPLECFQTGKYLGDTAFTAELWDIAIEGFAVAIEAVEQRRSWANSEAKRQDIVEEAIDIYEKTVQSYVNINRPDKAIEYIERSKARNLVDLLSSRELYSIQKISTDPNLKLISQVKPMSFAAIQALLKFEFDEKTAIVEWYILSEKILTFIITSQAKIPVVWESSQNDLENLVTLFGAYLEDYGNNKRQWQEQLSVRLQHLSQILHIDQVINYLPADCDRIIFIPHRFMHLLPLHALPLNEGQNHVIDIFLRGVSYAPSCQLLQLSQNQQRSDFIHLFAIQNPTQDLSFSNLEVETIRRYFEPNDYVLVKEAATKKDVLDNERFLNANCVHFSCHGYFNFESPLESALILADAGDFNGQLQENINENNRSLDSTKINLDKCLTLREILDLDLSQCCLVTLSACETGLIDFTSQSDEYIGLPSGFLVAGSSSVVSSLWSVSDFSTSFLMIKFYENLQSQTSVATALCQAQLWLRDATVAELKLWIDKRLSLLNPTQKMVLRRMFHKIQDNSKPFQDPFYWAAFCAVGEFKLNELRTNRLGVTAFNPTETRPIVKFRSSIQPTRSH